MNKKAKKSFGQHFLINESLASAIVDSLDYNISNNIVEVGPGKGVLTQFLLLKSANVRYIEADHDMVGYLHSEFPQLGRHLIQQDFLKTDLAALFLGEEFLLIGNFPYNISSQILFKVLEHKSLVPEMVGMFQLEVAERIVSAPNSKKYGVLSVLVQRYFNTEILFRVKPGSFNPPPKVHSAVIRLKRKETDELSSNEKHFKSVVKIAFNQRRKMLRNSLKSLIHSPELKKDPFLRKRPEQLSLSDFDQLTNKIYSQQ